MTLSAPQRLKGKIESAAVKHNTLSTWEVLTCCSIGALQDGGRPRKERPLHSPDACSCQAQAGKSRPHDPPHEGRHECQSHRPQQHRQCPMPLPLSCPPCQVRVHLCRRTARKVLVCFRQGVQAAPLQCLASQPGCETPHQLGQRQNPGVLQSTHEHCSQGGAPTNMPIVANPKGIAENNDAWTVAHVLNPASSISSPMSAAPADPAESKHTLTFASL